MSTVPRLLVTGARGRIGRRLRLRLEADGADASYLVSRREGTDVDPAVDGVDITDAEALEAVIAARRPDVVLHLASLTGAACDADPQLATAVNVDAVARLAALSAEHGVGRIVLASTSGVYGDRYAAPVAESGHLDAASLYARSKLDAEHALEAAVAGSASRLSAIALRIFNVFGPGMVDSLANRLVQATAESPVALAGLDGFVRDYVHVDDVAEAFVLAGRAEAVEPWSVLNVGTGRATSNRDLVSALEPVHVTVGEARDSYSCADPARATAVIGFTASRRLDRSTV